MGGVRSYTIAFPVSFNLKSFSIGELRVGVWIISRKRISGFLGEFHTSGSIESSHDSISYSSLSPDRTSGICYGEVSIRIGIGVCLDIGEFKSFGEIVHIGDSRGITGSARES